ncbi:MAG TPA: hypothetical protein VE085_12025 [Burkholderiales bacterium]|nr:hypothetical protein [Burkholderiales bacterium]
MPLAAAAQPIALYDGADRTGRLIDGARREGASFTLFTNLVASGEVPLALTV